jgi:pescadillo protein
MKLTNFLFTQIHLFAALPSAGRITSEHTVSCSELSRHWQYYVSKSKSLDKVFVSVKGIYFQAEIMGEPVNWVVPHKFTQVVPKEVDIRVMLTFLEFYEVFIKFVLFKLYHSQGMEYPPRIDSQLDQAGCFLLAVKANPLSESLVEADAKKLLLIDNKSVREETMKSQAKNSLALPADLPKLLDSIDASLDAEEGDEDDELGFLAAPLQAALLDRQLDINNEEEVEEEERIKTFALVSDDPRSRLFVGLHFSLIVKCL